MYSSYFYCVLQHCRSVYANQFAVRRGDPQRTDLRLARTRPTAVLADPPGGLRRQRRNPSPVQLGLRECRGAPPAWRCWESGPAARPRDRRHRCSYEHVRTLASIRRVDKENIEVLKRFVQVVIRNGYHDAALLVLVAKGIGAVYCGVVTSRHSRVVDELCESSFQAAHPGEYPDGLRRTVQRRARVWRRQKAAAMVFGELPIAESVADADRDVRRGDPGAAGGRVPARAARPQRAWPSSTDPRQTD